MSTASEIAKLPALQDVTSDAQLASPRVKIAINRDKAAALQINAQQIETAPWLLIFPATFLAATLFSFNFIGDGLRDALDPQDR